MENTNSFQRFLNTLDDLQTGSFDKPKFAVDSRNLSRGDIFIALPGKNCNGYEFLSDVYHKGAIAAIVPKSLAKIQQLPLPLYYVDDPLMTLQMLAHEKIQHHSPKIIAITGSVGKTTSKTFLTTLLEKKFRVMSTPGNQNSQIGLPLAILNNMSGDEEILILEMGMSEQGNIRRLVEIAPPDIAMITHVDLVHVENFDCLEEIVLEKASIFSHPNTKLGVFSDSIINKEIIYRTGVCQKLSFSVYSEEAKSILKRVCPPFNETHILNNLWGTIKIALYLGHSIEDIESSMPHLKLPEKRFNKIEKNGILFINDSYNACPISVIAGLNSLPKPKENRKNIAIIGEMLELGRFSKSSHEEIGQHALDKVDAMFCLGPHTLPIVDIWKNNNREVYYYEKLSDLLKVIKLTLKGGDVVFVKGSNAKEMWKIVEDFDQ